MLKMAVVLMVACQLAWAAGEVEDASVHNLAMADFLMGAQNPCAVKERSPTQEDIFYASGMKVVSAIPQVGNVTSDLASPRLLWAWYAKFPFSASFSVSSGNGCPDSKLDVYNPSNLRLDGAKLKYSYGSLKKEVKLSLIGPNPVELDLNQSHLTDAEFTQPYANLSVELSGQIGLDYSFRKTDYIMNCESGPTGSVCSCALRTAMGTKQYTKAASDLALLLVETGPVQEVWLNPPLQKRLAGNETGKVLLLARRMPSQVSVASDGIVIGLNRPYSFSSQNGPCGESSVAASFAPIGAGLALEKGAGTVFPSQLVDKNATYYPLYAAFDWNEAAGAKEVVISYDDWFSNGQNFTRDFSVREPVAFYANRSNTIMEMRGGTDSLSPAAYPGEEPAGALPDLSPIAILLAALFIGASYSLFTWLRRTE